MQYRPLKRFVKTPKTAPMYLAALSAAVICMSKATAQTPQQAGIWTIQGENASISTTTPTDRYYVNGIHLGWTSPTNSVPQTISSLANIWLGAGAARVSLGLTQQIFTPFDTKPINPPKNDEPYAGYLAVTLGLTQDQANTRTLLGLNLGLIGPAAGAEWVQNNFHSLIGQKGTHGWAHQLPTEPAIDISAARIWRVPMGLLAGLETDALPQISGMAGLTQDYLQPAIGFRIGSGLTSDYGPPLLTQSPTGGDAYNQVQPVAWYLFAGSAAKFVAHDSFLQGAIFRDSRSVPLKHVVGSFDVGAVLLWHGLRFSYVQMFQTDRFHSQRGAIHEFGSFSVSGVF